MKKPKVHIEARNGWLKLRWSHRGTRHEFALGLPDGPLNLKVAERKATEIEMDIATENFDPTLNKYRLATTQPKPAGLSIVTRLLAKVRELGTNRSRRKNDDLRASSTSQTGSVQTSMWSPSRNV